MRQVVQPQVDKTMTFDEVQEIAPFSRTQIGRLEKAGMFPRRIQFGPGRVGWIQSEILEWRNSRRKIDDAV